MLKKVLITLSVLLIVFAVLVSRQPNEFKVSRSVTMNAAPSVVFAEVNDLHRWEAWSPWMKLDPAAKSTYSGPQAGPGASMAWAGNHNVGEGSMTITESRRNGHIQFRLDFLKPFKATHTAEFTFKPEGKQTVVTWSMFGKNNVMSKIIGVFMSCDKMVGGQFEKGLADLKAIAEASKK